jgi:hypothetical protein
MQQAWRPTPERGFLAGIVRMGWDPGGLWVMADLPDRKVWSTSTDHGQKLWMLGDVFEIFLQREGSSRYLELHVSPNNHRLHIRWSTAGFEKMKAGQGKLSDFTADPQAFASTVTRLPGGHGWRVLARVPSTVIPGGRPLQEGDLFRLSFSRYNAAPDREKPILSSTSPHAVASYHRRHEWRLARLGHGR